MNNKSVKCEDCNSEVITYRKGKRWVAECSYCGKAIDKGTVFSDFMPEYSGDDEE